MPNQYRPEDYEFLDDPKETEETKTERGIAIECAAFSVFLLLAALFVSPPTSSIAYGAALLTPPLIYAFAKGTHQSAREKVDAEQAANFVRGAAVLLSGAIAVGLANL